MMPPINTGPMVDASRHLEQIAATLTDALDHNKSHIHARSDGSFAIGKRNILVRAFNNVRALLTRNDRLAQVNNKAISDFQEALKQQHGEKIAHSAIARGRARLGGHRHALSTDFIQATFGKVNDKLANNYKLGSRAFTQVYNPRSQAGGSPRRGGLPQTSLQPRASQTDRLMRNKDQIKKVMKEACALVSGNHERILTEHEMEAILSSVLKGMNFPAGERQGSATTREYEGRIQSLAGNVALD